ncbi:MAG: tRNA pseudouridine(38-40) synthase TruA [Thermoanaerobaculia bacterium]
MPSLPPFVDDRLRDHGPADGHYRYRLDIAYLGAGFGGWQRQPNADTVQARVEAALSELVGSPVAVVGASRTDAGVHARGQVAHVDLARPFSTQGLVFGTNHSLPPAIRVLAAAEAPRGFHARFSATAKEYAYRLRAGRFVAPDLAAFVLAVPDRFDLERLQAATLLLPGRHDFSCFALAGGSHRSPVRTIFRAAWEEEPTGLTLRITGDGFLRGMVRGLAGTLLEVALGQRALAEFGELLAGGERGAAGPTAPAHALALERIDYRTSF